MAEHLAPVDESVKVPTAVARAAAAAEAFYKQPTPDVDKADATVQIEPTPAVEPAAEAVTQPTPEPAPEPEPIPQEPDWEHRYRSMEGRVKQLTELNAMQSNQLAQLSTTVTQLQNPKQPSRPLVTDEERRAYGDDLLSVVERKALEAVQPHISELAQQNYDLQQRVQRDEARTIYDVLGVELPNWREINTSPDFLRWLALPDIYSGNVRSVMLKAAFNSGEAGRVLAFFRGFLADNPQLTGSLGQVPQRPAAQAPRQAAVQLRDLAAPGKARPATGNAPVPAEPIVITNRDIDRFYADVRRGIYAGRNDAKDAKEATIHAAIREGRVRTVK